jgi:hypothetical protein
MNYEIIDYWFNYNIKWGIRYLYSKIFEIQIKLNKYDNINIIPAELGNDYIKDMILSNKPFLAGRLGSCELNVVVKSIGVRLGINKEVKENAVKQLCNNAGFFPNNQQEIMKFGKLMTNSIQEVDLLGVWYNVMEDYIVKNYSNNIKLSELMALEPYYHTNPWSKALEGKNVLVIHPFESSIQKQFQRREKLFDDKNVLPKFNLKTLKAIQTIAGQKTEFRDWFEALDYMYNKAINIDFDIAIVGCGAYGFPLSAKLKHAGKQSIHMGGATQILFGIKGNRWDNDPIISKFYNEYWIRPDTSEIPQGAKTVEDACYW